jgi:hypothetical protein
MNGYFEQISGAVDALRIVSPGTYAWFGRRVQIAPARLRASLTPALTRRLLLAALSERLYADFYLRGDAAPSRTGLAGRAPDSPATRAAFVEALARANSGHGQWDDGWEVRAITPDGELLVERDGTALRVPRSACRPHGQATPAPGARVRIGPLRDDPAVAPGFFTVLGDARLADDAHTPLLRVYWNCMPAGAAQLVRLLSVRLNREEIPYRLKLVDNPAAFTRADAAVLYIEPERYDDVAPIVADVYPRMTPHLRAAVPALTLELAPGLGLAEDPGGDESFGTQRCRLLAEGIIQAWEQRRHALEARVLVVAECFAEAGVSFEAPFLNPGSTASYAFTLGPGRAQRTGPRASLTIAEEIGRQIVEHALWSGERCTWLGALPVDPQARGRTTTWETLPADLYSGTAGVGMLLAELYRQTGDAELRRTALGALRQAIATSDRLPPVARLGLYTGLPGVALACARAATLLDDAETLDGARRIVTDPTWLDPSFPYEHDLLSGAAGAISALLALRDLLPDAPLIDSAALLGERLLGAARMSEEGCSWGQAARPAAPHLTGLAHGASGIGLALLELWHATGDGRFREAAERAFAWERQWFDPPNGNWPDFREARLRDGRPPRLTPQATFWCHGAPGIALARARAWQLTGDPRSLEEAQAALATTRRALARELHPATLNFSLCHGFAGLAGVLLQAQAMLPDTDITLAHSIAHLGARLHATPGGEWPCGTHSAATPGLMLGLAGIAWFYLRLHDSATPGVLLMRGS